MSMQFPKARTTGLRIEEVDQELSVEALDQIVGGVKTFNRTFKPN